MTEPSQAPDRQIVTALLVSIRIIITKPAVLPVGTPMPNFSLLLTDAATSEYGLRVGLFWWIPEWRQRAAGTRRRCPTWITVRLPMSFASWMARTEVP